MIARSIGLLAVGVSLLVAAAPSAGAQMRRTTPLRDQRPAQPPVRRQQLEQQLRRRLWSVTKDRVGLDEAQMARLGETNQRFDTRRRSLNQQERAQRTVLHDQLLAGEGADQSRIAAALDGLQAIQRQRLELQTQEQQELATFMTPLQRAKYAALQEQVRRRIEALRRQRPDSAGPGTP